MLLTGGYWTRTKVPQYSTVQYTAQYSTVQYSTVQYRTLPQVSRYTWAVSWWEQQGWVEDLPELGVGRHQHGCGAYTGPLGQASSEHHAVELQTVFTITEKALC